MPRFDGRGPRGMGAGTGWGLGPCGAGRAWGRGGGYGYGWRASMGRGGYYPPYPAPYAAPVQPDPQEEKEFLADQLQYLESELSRIRSRMDEIDKA